MVRGHLGGGALRGLLENPVRVLGRRGRGNLDPNLTGAHAIRLATGGRATAAARLVEKYVDLLAFAVLGLDFRGRWRFHQGAGTDGLVHGQARGFQQGIGDAGEVLADAVDRAWMNINHPVVDLQQYNG